MTIIQKSFKVISLERQLYETPSLNMDEVKYLKKFKWSKTMDPKKKAKKEKRKQIKESKISA